MSSFPSQPYQPSSHVKAFDVKLPLRSYSSIITSLCILFWSSPPKQKNVGEKIPFPLCSYNIWILNFCLNVLFCFCWCFAHTCLPFKARSSLRARTTFWPFLHLPWFPARVPAQSTVHGWELGLWSQTASVASLLHDFFTEDHGQIAYPLYASVFSSVKWRLITVPAP